MAEISLTIKGMDKLEKAFKRMPGIMIEKTDKVVKEAAVKITADAIRFAPVNKQSGGGNLRQSIRFRPTGRGSAVVEATVKYAAAVHEGTTPHIITVQNAKVLANRRTGQFFGKKVNHPGTKAQPFLQKAVDQNESWLNKELSRIGDEILSNLIV